MGRAGRRDGHGDLPALAAAAGPGGGAAPDPAGILTVDAVTEVDPTAIAEDDAHAAGLASRAELLRRLDRHGDGPLYRVDLHHPGADPGEALRQADDLPEAEQAGLLARLGRLDPPAPSPGGGGSVPGS